MTALQNTITKLKEELSQKDALIQSLKSDLQSKEDQLASKNVQLVLLTEEKSQMENELNDEIRKQKSKIEELQYRRQRDYHDYRNQQCALPKLPFISFSSCYLSAMYN